MTLRFLLPFVLTLAACSVATHPKVIQKTIPPVVVVPPTPPISATPAPAPAGDTDDTAAVQALLDKGGLVQLEGRVYHFTKTLAISKSGTTLQGMGTATELDFAPPDPGKGIGCVNDRAIDTLCGISNTVPLEIAQSIEIGDTSFVVAHAADATNLQPGDWVLIGDWDTLVEYITILDWMQIASVDADGVTIHTMTPFRMAFAATVPFVPQHAGLGFQRINLIQNVTIQNFTLVVEQKTSDNYAGIDVCGTLNTLVQNVSIIDYNGQPFASYLSKGTTFKNNTSQGANSLNEFASSVDLTVENNTFSATGSPGIGLDLGTGFFTVKNNNVPTSANAGIYALYNVHDGVIEGNTVGDVSVANGVANAIGVLLEGSPNVTVTGNTLSGGVGDSTGVYIGPYLSATYSESDTGDTATGNTITGFSTNVIGP